MDSLPEIIELDCGNIVVGERSELAFFFDRGEELLFDFLLWFLLFTLSFSLLFAECDVISVNILLYSMFHNNFIKGESIYQKVYTSILISTHIRFVSAIPLIYTFEKRQTSFK